MTALRRLSIELHDRCGKACWFCYNHSAPTGRAAWAPGDVIALVRDCADHGLEAVSFGGGEPLEYPGLFEVLAATRGALYRSFTSNGLLLDGLLDEIVACAPDRVHLSIHAPAKASEVDRVLRQVQALAARGIASGVNLLVQASQLAAAARCAARLRDQGLSNERVVYLPMRGGDTPSPAQLAVVAGATPFQSMTCLERCGPSPRFASLDSQRRVAFCSYTRSRRPLPSLGYAGLLAALRGLDLEPCGPAAEQAPAAALVTLRRADRASDQDRRGDLLAAEDASGAAPSDVG